MGSDGDEAHEFYPQRFVRRWDNGYDNSGLGFRIADALTGVVVFGATGSGKTSGPAKNLALGYLNKEFGGLVLCSKKDECQMWQAWARSVERQQDLIIIDAKAKHRFNFIDWEASRAGEGGGFTINIVNLLDDVAGAISSSAGKAEGGGNEKFWDDALHLLNVNLVDLCNLGGLKLSLSLLRSILNSAPQNMEEVNSPIWKEKSECAQLINEVDKFTLKGNPDVRADFEECRNYWLKEFPGLSDRTRSIIVLMFSMLARPLVTRPLRKLFAADTNITPEAAFDGKIIIVDLPVQEYRLAGRVANLVWKYCMQVAILRRVKPAKGYLRPVFIWGDECQNFVSKFDSEYQAVARSAGGCTVYLTQNRESLLRVLGNPNTVDSLLGNLQAKFFCQNSGDTNEWASKLLGERYLFKNTTNFGSSGAEEKTHSAGVSRAEQKRHYVEPAQFTTLKRGGEVNQLLVETILYNGGYQFAAPAGSEETKLPYKLLTFDQRDSL